MKLTSLSILLCGLLSTPLSQAANDPTPVYSWSWSPSGANINADGWNNSFTYTEGNDYATFSSSESPWKSNITGFTGDFTVTFDIKNLTTANSNWNTLFSLYSNNQTNGDNYSLQLQFNTSGQLYLYDKAAGSIGYGGGTTGVTTETQINSGLTSSGLLHSTDWTNIRIVSDISNQTLSLFINGTQQGVIENWNPATPALTGAQFGATFGNTRTLQGSIDINNIAFYNSVVLPVPEASTCALSLLAAAGLLVKRRRD